MPCYGRNTHKIGSVNPTHLLVYSNVECVMKISIVNYVIITEKKGENSQKNTCNR